MTHQIEIPHLEFFAAKNIFTGSAVNFRFQIEPKDGILHTTIYDTYCFELAPKLGTFEAPLEQKGLDDTLAWIREQYQSYSV